MGKLINKLVDNKKVKSPLSENRYLLIKVLSCINTTIWLFIIFLMHYVWDASWVYKLIVLSVLFITTPSLQDLKKPYEQYLKEWEENLKAREIRPICGIQAMIQKRGIVIKKCDPEGKVKIGNEFWSALTIDGRDMDVGTDVIVRSIEGMKVIVEKNGPRRDQKNGFL